MSDNPPSFAEVEVADNNDNAQSQLSTEPSAPTFKLFFKCENFQKIGAFKARGAFHAVTRLIDEMGVEEVRRRGVVTHSSGKSSNPEYCFVSVGLGWPLWFCRFCFRVLVGGGMVSFIAGALLRGAA